MGGSCAPHGFRCPARSDAAGMPICRNRFPGYAPHCGAHRQTPIWRARPGSFAKSCVSTHDSCARRSVRATGRPDARDPGGSPEWSTKGGRAPFSVRDITGVEDAQTENKTLRRQAVFHDRKRQIQASQTKSAAHSHQEERQAQNAPGAGHDGGCRQSESRAPDDALRMIGLRERAKRPAAGSGRAGPLVRLCAPAC